MGTFFRRIAPLLFAWAALAGRAYAGEPDALALGREIVFLKPAGSLGEAFNQFSFAFDLAKRNEAEEVTGPVRRYAPLVRAVREYREFVAGRKGEPVPLFVALGETRDGTAFCVTQPAAVRVVERGGRVRVRALFEPIIYLSQGDLQRIRSGRADGPEVLCHEIGHAFMAQAYGLLAFPGESPEHIVQLVTREGHWYTKETDPVFAYTEGWAEYVQCHYVGTSPPERLIRLPEEGGEVAGKATATRPMSAAEIRRHEGAQAYLLFHLERRLQRPGLFDEFLEAMVESRPRTLNGLLRAHVARHPDQQGAIDAVLSEVSNGAFKVDYTYDRDDLKDETRGSWDRLREALRKRLRGE